MDLHRPTLGDLDGDGDLDLVLGSDHVEHLQYYPNNGKPTSPSYVAKITVEDNPLDGMMCVGQCGVALGDLDGDGVLDLIVSWDVDDATGGDSTLHLLILGTFRTDFGGFGENIPTFAAITGAANPYATVSAHPQNFPALGDLDGDDDLDLVLCYEGQSTIFYHENQGSETSPAFVEATGANNPFEGIELAYHPDGSDNYPALADLDGDDDLDIAIGTKIADGTRSLTYYENTGTKASPTFESRDGDENPFDELDPGEVTGIAFADVDGDYDFDLVVGSNSNDVGVVYFENVGSATAPTYEEITDSGNPFDIDFDDFDLSGTAPALGDIDSDGE